MKTIRNITSILTVAIIALAFAACNKPDPAQQAEAQLSKAISELTLPAKLNDGSTLLNCYMKDRVLTFRCEIPKKEFKKMDAAKQRESTLERLRTGLYPQKFIKKIIESNTSVRYIYICGKDSVSFTYAPRELE